MTDVEAAKAIARLLLKDVKKRTRPSRSMHRMDMFMLTHRMTGFRFLKGGLVSVSGVLDRKKPDEILSRARSGDPDARDAIKEAIEDATRKGRTPPFDVREIEAKLRKRTGRPGHDQIVRDWMIAAAVERIRPLGFKRKRNRYARDAHSACSIVHEVLTELGVAMSEANVVAISDKWGRYYSRV